MQLSEIQVMYDNNVVSINSFKQHLTHIQYLFLKKFAEPFRIISPNAKNTTKKSFNTNKEKIIVNSLRDIIKDISIHIMAPFTWCETNKYFSKLYNIIRESRNKIFDEYAEDILFNNILSHKEISLIFYLKNRMPKKWRDDQVLNQMYLQTKELNFNFIKTSVDSLNSDQLVKKAAELTEKLSNLRDNKDKKVKVIDVSSASS